VSGDEREVLDWSTFGEAARELASQVVESGYEPDVVLAIARGGLTVAGAVAYSLGIKNCFTVNVEYYTGIDERQELPVLLPPVPDPVGLHDLAVLVVDDVADTGHTLAAVHDFLAGHVAEVRAAVLYEKPRSVIHPAYVWRRTDLWIAFPWSAEGPVPGAAGR
jgi:hypoxanthine phosphoribosyltransferase